MTPSTITRSLKSLVKAGCVGKIYEQKGWKGKAIEDYEKFLTLWKDADPGLAEVEDMRERLESPNTSKTA